MLAELLFSLTARASNFDDYPACKAVQSKTAPHKDLPSKDEVEKLKGCDAKGPYYGIGEPIDYKKARLCSFAQRETNTEMFWGGSTVLYMIYANGYGTARNLDLALLYACTLDAAPAEMEARIRHIEELRKGSIERATKPLDLCDDITSGNSQGFCQQIISDRKAAERKGKFDKLKFGDVKKFEALKASAAKFRDTRVENEVDQSGTARSMQSLQERDIQDQDFYESLEKFSKKQTPRFGLKTENDLMNKTFKKIMANKEKSPWGTVTKDGILKTQKAWVEYRNAWKAFAKAEKADADQVDAWFTKKRTHMLQSILGERP